MNVAKENFDELDIYEIFSELYKQKFFIFIISLTFGFAGLFYSLQLDNIYRSTSVLSINLSSENQSSALSSRLGGIASLAGFSIGSSGGQDQTQLAIATIKSKDFLNSLIQKENILPMLMAVSDYDVANNKIFFDKKIYDDSLKKWTRESNYPLLSKPNYIEAHQKYIDLLNINFDSDTGLIYLSFDHISPIFAKDFLLLIIDEINIQGKKKDIIESTNALNYLNEVNANILNVEVKSSISSLIESQLEKKMLASIKDEYVLKIVDSPFIPIQKHKPSRIIILIVSIFMGVIFSTFYVLFLFYKNKRR